MNNFKKILSLTLVLMMVVATMMIAPLTASAQDEITSGGGTGTKNDPFIVFSPRHLADHKSVKRIVHVATSLPVSGG